MLVEIHKTLQRLLYEYGHIDPHDVDIQFEAPTRERVEQMLRPTISLFLFDMQENVELRQNTFQTVGTGSAPVRATNPTVGTGLAPVRAPTGGSAQQSGRVERRMAPRRFDLRYMVSALSSEVEDEHQLLWRVLVTLMQHQHMPENLLHEGLSTLDPPLVMRVDPPAGERSLTDLWSTLGGPPHPAFCYVVTVPVDMDLVIDAPLVLTRTTRYTNTQTQNMVSDVTHQIGGVVRNESGEPLAGVKVMLEGEKAGIGMATIRECVTNEEGRFLLRGLPTGTARLRLTLGSGGEKIVTVVVPAWRGQATPNEEQPSYDIILETPANQGT